MTRTAPPPQASTDPVRAILQLFEGPLIDLRFPDLDREVLAAAAGEVERHQAELQRALQAVQDARLALEAKVGELEDLAARAHAYATVYAHDKPDLAEELARIRPRGPVAPAKKRRGRPRKKDPKTQDPKTQTSLSVAEDAA